MKHPKISHISRFILKLLHSLACLTIACLTIAISDQAALPCIASRHPSRKMAFRASCRLALRAARSKMGSCARPALAAVATGSLAAGYALSKPSGCQATPLVDVSGLTKVAKTDDVGLLPQPINPKYKTALVQIYVPSQPFGGSDKSNWLNKKMEQKQSKAHI